MNDDLFTVESELVNSILRCCRRLHGRDMLAAADGNVSCRVGDERILVTPSGVNKAMMTIEQLAVVRLDGTVVSGNPSSETKMHLAVFNKVPEARCVIHAHPPHAVAWSIAEPAPTELPVAAIAEVLLTTGGIPIVPYETPGSQELADAVAARVPGNRAMILARHGALTWGEDVDEAYNGMERVEHSAKILFLASRLGPIAELPQKEVDKLRALREKLGPRIF